ncbi:MAG TPA: MMPL family transporter [Miltoncostaeaceae bacterium]|nr:MMPL family transporter [Miltoncostaeaceae bacterium]
MAGILYRLGRWIAAHRWLVLGAWILLVVAFVFAISRVGAETSNNVDLPGTGSQKATDLLADRFPPQQNGQNPIVFHVDSGKLTASDNEKAINQAAKAIQGLPYVVSAPSPFGDQPTGTVSDDEKTAFIPVLLDISSADLDEEEAQAVLDAAEKPAEPLGMEVAAGGSIGSELSTPATESSELIGIIVAMIILTLAFGSIVAMGMPIISAVVGLAVGLTGIGLVGHLFAVPDVGTTLAIMIGLGVGIDYALFLVSRHRAQLAEGEEMRESIALALATSGSAIVFAGGTVVIALVSLAVAGIPLVSSLGYSSAIAVLTAVLAATTLLPAVMSLVGRHIHSLSLPAFLRPRPKEPGTGHWARWGRLITRHPLIAIACFLALLAVLIVPLFALELGQEDVGATPKDTQERQSYDLISAGFGPGYNGPLLIATELGTPATTDPKVQQQEDQANALQSQLEAEQKEGQQQQAALEAEWAELQAQQAELESEQASLEAQAAELGREAEGLRAEQRRVEAERAQLEAEIAAIRGRRGDLFQRAEALLERYRAAQSQRQAREARLGEVIAAAEAAEARIAAAPPEAQAAIRAQAAQLRAEAQRLRGVISAARAQEAQLLEQAADLRRQAAAAAGSRPPETLRQQVQQLANDAAQLASNAASLERQKASLEAQGAELQSQGEALQAQAADLQEQKAELEQLQATAAQQQKQAESLKNQLTQELTKAGGDPRGTDPRLVKLQDALGAADGVSLVSPPQINDSGDAVIYSVIATTAPSDPETADLVEELRSTTIPEATAGEDVQAYVGGSTASNVDLAAEITSRLPLVIIVVLLLSIIVLTIAFRSLLVPLQAALTNVLCVGAAFGILTAAFQWGWGIDILGIDTDSDSVPIASYVPLMMFAVLFGLSMDYQVFLLSAVAMRRQVGDDDKRAIAWGMEHSGPVITAAGLIMIGVFGSFILNGDPTVKQFGVGLASAVALAASAVLVLVPAVLTLMGRWAWWMPGWLGKVVPTVDIEGEGLLRRRAAEGTLPGVEPASAEGESPR